MRAFAVLGVVSFHAFSALAPVPASCCAFGWLNLLAAEYRPLGKRIAAGGGSDRTWCSRQRPGFRQICRHQAASSSVQPWHRGAVLHYLAAVHVDRVEKVFRRTYCLCCLAQDARATGNHFVAATALVDLQAYANRGFTSIYGENLAFLLKEPDFTYARFERPRACSVPESLEGCEEHGRPLIFLISDSHAGALLPD